MTQTQLEDLFWRVTVMCLGLDPDSEKEAVQKRVRISWPTSETGNSNWERDEDVVFLRISPGFDPYGTLHEVEHITDADTGEAIERVTYQRSIRVNWVCYGPNSDEDADKIRIGLFRASIHAYLMLNNIAIQPHIREPVRRPELDDTGEWWERSDLVAECYEGVAREYTEEFIAEPPTINLDA